MPRIALSSRRFGRFALGIGMVLSAVVGSAGVNSWSPIGPAGGDIRSIAIDQLNPALVYAGTQSGGVFRSTDGGASWSAAAGLTYGSVGQILIDPNVPTRIYACSGIFIHKSIDGGQTWTLLGQASPGALCGGNSVLAFQRFAIDPLNGFVLYAAGVNRGGIVKSVDGGMTWASINSGLPPSSDLNWLVISSRLPVILYAKVSVNNVPQGIFRSSDGGASWSGINAGLPDAYVWSLVVAPSSPSTLYVTAGNPTSSAYRSTDAGTTWVKTSQVYVVGAVDPTNPAVVYTSNLAYRSTDGGVTWSDLGNRFTTNAIAIDPQSPNTFYAAGTGLLKSTDGAMTWKKSDQGMSGLIIYALAVDPSNGSAVYVAALSDHVYRTADEGATWTPASGGLQPPFLPYLAVDPRRPETIYYGDSTGVFKSLDRGSTWNATNLTASVEGLVIDPGSSAVYAGVAGGGIFKSTDGGDNWIATGVAGDHFQGLAISGSNPKILYASTRANGVFKTTDGAASWAKVAVPPGVFGPASGLVAIDPFSAETAYLEVDSKDLYKTTNGGSTWAKTGLHANVTALVFDPSSPGTLYAGAVGGTGLAVGVFRSHDGGVSWTEFNAGLTIPSVFSLGIDRTGTRLHAGTLGGVYLYQIVPARAPLTRPPARIRRPRTLTPRP